MQTLDVTTVTPIVMHGLGRSLPKGEALLVPFNCDVIIGEAMRPKESSTAFIARLADNYQTMLELCITRCHSVIDSEKS